MKFYINGEYVEVLNVETEVNLNKKFNKEWDKIIIVDILATTAIGYIVVEINYTHAKDWEDLIKYYSELNLIEVYEVIISEDPIIAPVWKSMNELLKRSKEKFQIINMLKVVYFILVQIVSHIKLTKIYIRLNAYIDCNLLVLKLEL